MTPRIASVDLRAATREQRDELLAAAASVIDAGRYILGPQVARFEAAFAGLAGTRHCAGVGSGLDALELCLRALGVGAGDEVIVPSNSYFATWLAVARTGALPVPVEPRLATFNLDPSLLEAAITPRTRAVLPVHLYGQPCEMDAIAEPAAAHGLAVVEDAAQAHGAAWRGRPAGSLGDAAAWSFYPTKNLGALGDAGAVTTDRADLDADVRVRRDYGSRERYVSDVLGCNSRLDELQAALLSVRLTRLASENAHRRRVAAWYAELLAGSGLALPEVADGAEPVWHQFVVRHPHRDALRAHLASRGIETLVHYPVPPHLQGAFRHLGHAEGAFPLSERIHREVLSLPIGMHIGHDEVQRVAEAIRAWVS